VTYYFVYIIVKIDFFFPYYHYFVYIDRIQKPPASNTPERRADMSEEKDYPGLTPAKVQKFLGDLNLSGLPLGPFLKAIRELLAAMKVCEKNPACEEASNKMSVCLLVLEIQLREEVPQIKKRAEEAVTAEQAAVLCAFL